MKKKIHTILQQNLGDGTNDGRWWCGYFAFGLNIQ